MGDFNIDLLKYSIDNDVTDFVNTLFSNYCQPLITRPTCITNATTKLRCWTILLQTSLISLFKVDC